MSNEILHDLEESISRLGFYPELVKKAVGDGLLGLEPVAHLVHLETHIDNAEIHRHITVLAITGELLMIAHLDDQQLDEEGESVIAHVNVETVRISSLRSVGINYSYPQPHTFEFSDEPSELSLTISWTGGQRFDLQPAHCPDPLCTADHGYSGVAPTEDVVLRISGTADGSDAVSRAKAFALELRRRQLGL